MPKTVFHKSPILIFTLLIAFLSTPTHSEEIINLNTNNLQQTISDLAYVLILFYHPADQASQVFLPHFSNSSQQLSDQGHHIQFAKVDITKQTDIAHQYRVGDYPAIKLHIFGKLHEYNEPINMPEILDWMEQKLAVPEPVTSPERFEEILKENSVVIVYWNNVTGNDFVYFSYYTQGLENIKRVFTEHKEIKEKYIPEENMQTQISLFKNFDEGRVDYTGYMNEYTFKRWINQNKDPLIVEFDGQYIQKFFHDDLPTIILITSNNQESKKAFDALTSLAPQYKGKAYMTTINHEKELGHELLKIFYEKEQIDFPLLAIVKPGFKEPVRYVYDDTYISEKVIQQFYQDVNDQSISPHYKSEPAMYSDEELVHTVVGKNFKNIVLDQSKHVFVLFYAPWSKEATEFIKIWEEFAETVKPVPDLVIAKMNVEANEAPGVRMRGVMSLVLYTKGNTENGLEYYGEKDANLIWEWLEGHIAEPEVVEEEEQQDDAKKDIADDPVLFEIHEKKEEEKDNKKADKGRKEKKDKKNKKAEEKSKEDENNEKEEKEAEEERKRLEREAFEKEKERHRQMEKQRMQEEVRARLEREREEKAAHVNADL